MKIYVNTNWADEDRMRLRESVHAFGHEIDFAPPTEKPSPAGVAYSKQTLLPADQYDVAFGQPPLDWMLRSTRLRWIQISSAGYTKYDRDDVRAWLKTRNAVFTNASSILADPCAQHVLAYMMAATRQLHAFADAQRDKSWSAEQHRPSLRVLDGDAVLIVGFGSIGARLVELLQPMNVSITGIRAHPRGDEPIPTHSTAELDRLLETADHVVNLLPAASSTVNVFNEARFKRMKRGATFYNIGRGSTVDQAALIGALRSAHLKAAYLDVTTPEPLPPESPLWTTPNCHITPHIGGAMQDAAMRQTAHFVENLKRFESGQPLRDRIFR